MQIQRSWTRRKLDKTQDFDLLKIYRLSLRIQAFWNSSFSVLFFNSEEMHGREISSIQFCKFVRNLSDHLLKSEKDKIIKWIARFEVPYYYMQKLRT